MQSHLSPWSRDESLHRHWSWRPEWRHDRPCLYWYLTFDRDAIADAAGLDALEAVRNTPWLDPVPLEWMHLTLCDLGFVDQVHDDVVHRAVRELDQLVPPLELPALTLGPLTSMESAVVLAAGPLEEVRRLQGRVRSVTEAALGPGRQVVHRHRFWPHVSLGYANRSVSGDEVRALTDAFGELRAPLPVEKLVLAAVTRERRHYQWTVWASMSAGPAPPAPAHVLQS